MEEAIKICHLTKVFGSETVLRDINGSFEKGKVHGIVGFNGSGKSVLFKCICGMIRPTKGRIYVQGKRIGRDVDFPQSLGVIIEMPGFLPAVSGYKNLKILASLNGKISNQQIRDAMERAGLDPMSRKPVGKYSLGMRERLGIAQAVMEDPQLLILDEPFNGLDKNGVQEVYELVGELKDRGKTILLASHNAADIENLCDTVSEMDGGRLVQM